ncbi:MAG: hypothetical protein ABGY29_10765, partial [bacterium]
MSWTSLLIVAAAVGLGPAQPAGASSLSQDDEGGEVITLLHPDGSKARKGRIEDGRRAGEWVAWHPTGELAYRGTFKDYLREGSWTFWRPDGTKRMAGVFQNDQRHGLFSMYGLEGALISRANWSKGLLHGQQERFFMSGKSKSVLTWVAGQQTGPATFYREAPDQKAEREPGAPVPMRRSLFEEGAYSNGRKTGIWMEHHPNGQVKATGAYLDDERNGLWRFYTTDGSDEARGEYAA